MAKKIWLPVAAAVVVTAVALKAEEKSDGAIAEGTSEIRSDVLVPVLGGVVGGLGDALLVFREEGKRQGVNPGAVLSGPTATIETNPRDVAELPPLEGDELP